MALIKQEVKQGIATQEIPLETARIPVKLSVIETQIRVIAIRQVAIEQMVLNNQDNKTATLARKEHNRDLVILL